MGVGVCEGLTPRVIDDVEDAVFEEVGVVLALAVADDDEDELDVALNDCVVEALEVLVTSSLITALDDCVIVANFEIIEAWLDIADEETDAFNDDVVKIEVVGAVDGSGDDDSDEAIVPIAVND